MDQTSKDVYQRWIDLYDQGAPDEAMKLTAPGFVMVTPDGRARGRAEADAFVAQIKAYVAQAGLTRKTTLKALHARSIAGGHTLIYATVELAFTTPAGDITKLPFLEVMHISPEGISFDAFAKLAESQPFPETTSAPHLTET
jgi:hypothetical protein